MVQSMPDTSLLKAVAERGAPPQGRKQLQRFDWLQCALEVFVSEGIDAVRIKHLDVNQHEAAYRAGEVDAVVTFEPFNTRLKELGAREIFSSREIPGEIVDVLVVHEDIHRTRLDDLRHLTQSWFAALDYIDAEPQKAATIMGKRLKIRGEDVLAAYQGIELPSQEQNIAMLDDGLTILNKLAEIMTEHELVSNDLELERVLTSDALHPE